jgi:Leucine-rich repeat (LRR) protein
MTTFTTNSTDVLQLLSEITDKQKIEKIKNMYITFTLKDNIIPSISRFTSLVFLDISMNKIKTISKEIVDLKNLKVFKADHNIITCIPYYFFDLTELTEISIKNNKIKTLPIKIKKLKNLQILDISANSIRTIPREISNLTELTYLRLSLNKISDIPCEIGKLTKLTFLNLSYNKITYIPPEIGNLKELVSLYIIGCKLLNIPNEIENLVRLENLQLSGNLIDSVPNGIGNLINLKGLYLNYNIIRNLPNEIENLVNLEELFINYNRIVEFPIYVINLRRLIDFKFDNNPFNYIPPQVYRFIRLLDITNNNLPFYNDDQNIHDNTIQKSVKDSIIAITSKKIDVDEDKIMDSIYNDPILTIKTKQLLVEFSDSIDYHSVLLITFKELLMYVWCLIETNQFKDNIKEVLNTEILDSECKCFTGRLTRLLNCLNGFSDLVEIKIADNQQIGIIILLIKNDLLSKDEYTVEKHKKLVVEELKSRGYADDLITEWVEQIDE